MESKYAKTAEKAHKILEAQLEALARISDKAPLGTDEILRLEVLVKTLAVLAEKLRAPKRRLHEPGNRISDADLEAYARGK